MAVSSGEETIGSADSRQDRRAKMAPTSEEEPTWTSIEQAVFIVSTIVGLDGQIERIRDEMLSLYR